ncbi:hypothetical protein DPMN_143694 [Dreissena polymorpha]|uniref:Uncharacterized protein n=1 Tax=Dreissena polymorpha TaxID=45954 RepID=A0A9D4GE15_DREPO|nr:hypothetical protein DPMN_143694 [Dreissena polymorpha]
MVSQTQKKKNQTGIIYKLSRDIITNSSNNCLTSLKLPYPTAAMFLKGQGPFSNYADISFERKVLCKSHNDCAKHQTSRVSQDSHVFNEQKSFSNTLLIYHKTHVLGTLHKDCVTHVSSRVFTSPFFNLTY